ncbi:uncharacterized protein LOC132306387 [Cornus florida]|uniref:uncharacterized protein LOC132306387 n=1 Tax=Cornus florida TaxID=4283 RepID=UPI00289E7E31|nr:uncharacterized protein LOC132306387 [Cornus florida]
MASTKRELPKAESGEPETKKTKFDKTESKAKTVVELNPADCDLDFNVEGNGLQGSALHEQGFAYCWSGARANVGITGGKYCFGCKIILAQPVVMEDTNLDQQHVCRLGISRGDDSVGNLGETPHSFGFGGTGKFSKAGKFSDYGEKYGVGDTIVCAVNLENKPLASIGFSKNGKWLGTAIHFNAGPRGLGVVDSPTRKLQWESALFPHVLLKNVVVQVQFSIEDGLVPEQGYKPWASAIDDGNAIMGPTFSNQRDCEVMMMVGLPASGKTTWAEKWVKDHPEKRYVLLGTNLALDQMKVPGLLRKQNYGERFDRLMDRATGIFNTLLLRASKTSRNYILDQTNVYKSARKRKLRPFANYRKIAVVVFPKPEELTARSEKRFKEMGKEVPAEAVNEMLANFALPVSKDMAGADEYFDQVMFPEHSRVEIQKYLYEMKRSLESTRNSMNNTSPYSRESSVQSYGTSVQSYGTRATTTPYSGGNPIQSYCGTSIHNQGTVPVAGGHCQSSHPPQPPLNYGYQSPWQASSAYLGAEPLGRTESFSSNQSPALRDVPFGNYSSTGGSLHRGDFKGYGSYDAYGHMRNDNASSIAIPGGATDSYGTYGAGDLYNHPSAHMRNDNASRIAIPGGATDSYGTYGAGDLYNHPSAQNRNFIPGGATTGATYGESALYNQGSYQGGSLSYNSHGGHSGSGSPLVNLQSPRQQTFLQPPPITYDSQYASPVPRPPTGNIPTYTQYSGGYGPPRPY